MESSRRQLLFLPGLGYTQEIFGRLPQTRLPEARLLNWIDPHPNESRQAYARRWFQPYSNLQQAPLLIGHSFGGMMAQEIAAIFPIHRIILISNVRCREQLPLGLRLASPLRIYRLFTRGICIKTVRFWGKVHDLRTQADQDLFKRMVGSYSNPLLQWSLKRLSEWTPPPLPNTTPLHQIHGTNDKTLPISRAFPPDQVIKDGSHIMLYQQAEELGRLIDPLLSPSPSTFQHDP
ncbi:MAG: alpha/beta hydrolase [Bacteroidota bacterium]